ncbi:MAG TPA: hypothetical protein VGB98_04420, partial [Pyrinomonadaceae bacterium]
MRIPCTPLRRHGAAALLLAFICSALAFVAHAQTPTTAGTSISNRARVSYADPDGVEVSVLTNTVTVIVEAVNGVSVTPDETEPSGSVDANDTVTAPFGVCNAGNQTVSFVLADSSVTAPAQIRGVHLDSDNSGTASTGDGAVSLGSTGTPALAPGACSTVLVVYSVNGATAQSQLVTTLTARTPAGVAGQDAEDTGTIRRTVKTGPVLRNPDDPQLPPLKLVNGVAEVTASQNQVVDFQVAFRNVGEGRALGVVVTDSIPRGLSFVPGSLRLVVGERNATLTDAADNDEGGVVGQALEVRLPSVASGEAVYVSFSARVEPLPGGTLLVNRANVSADNAQAATTPDARVLVAPQGVVFDGGGGQASPVASASLRVLAESSSGSLLALPASGFAPNGENTNPFSTGADGTYCFRLPSLSGTSTYYLLLSATNYRPRVIAVHVTPQSDGRFGMTMAALDGQPLAAAGGFGLTTEAVSFDSLGALASNIPVFPAGGIEVSKSADRATAQIGDVVSYRVEVKNASRVAVRDLEIRDTLPQSFYYAEGTATLAVGGAQARPVEPVVNGDTLTFRIAELRAGESATLIYRVRIGVNASLGEQFNTVVVRGGGTDTPPTRVGVVVKGGIFGTTQFVVGRVYVDSNADGQFNGGDSPVAGARVVTSTGRVVITDAAGNYNLPLLPDGALVVQLDRSSVPEGYAPHDRLRLGGGGWGRLVATPMQGGAMLHTSFALVAVDTPPSASDAPSPSGGQGREEAGPAGRPGPAPVTSEQAAQLPKVTPPLPSPTTKLVASDAARVEPAKPKSRGNIFKRVFGGLFGRGSNKRRDTNAKSLPKPSATPIVIYSAAGDVIHSEPKAADSSAQIVSSTAPAPSPTPDAPAPDGAQLMPATPLPPPGVSYSAATADTAAPSVQPAPTSSAQIVPVSLSAGGAKPSAAPASDGAATAPAGAHAGLPKVEPGAIVIGLEENSVLLTPGLDVPVRYALGWDVRLTVNGTPVESSRIGERVLDRASQTEQATFVGLNLAAGPNRLRVVVVSPEGVEGASREVVVYGRGPAARLVIESPRSELTAGRRDETEIVVRAYDSWGNPAQDGEVALSTTLGTFEGRREAKSLEVAREDSTVTRGGSPLLVSHPAEVNQQSAVRLVGGVARVQFVAPDAPGTARLAANTGEAAASAEILFRPEDSAPRMMVGYGNLTIGRAAPVMGLRGVDETVRGSMQFFYKGRLWRDNLLTLSYDSQRPLQRLDAQDRQFQLDPLDNTYLVFGDSSTRFNSAPSNSKLYARLDFSRSLGRSYALFGDFVPETRGVELAVYNRKLTGVQLHFENSRGDFVSVGGARPSSSYGRDVFPGGVFGLVRLSSSRVIPGSETVTLEIRDRRNPDLLVRREQLVRGADYNLDSDTGQIFFIRPIQAFDPDLNLKQIVVAYEFESVGAASNVYTLNASRGFGDGGRFGFSLNHQGRASSADNYTLGGFYLTQEMPNKGQLRLEVAASVGNLVGFGNYFGGGGAGSGTRHDGNALLALYDQPLKWRHARLQMSFRRASEGFFNPFGSSMIGGTQRAGASLDLQASPTSRLRLGVTDERNETDTVKNDRQTFGVTWTQRLGEKFTGTLAYDYRHLDDESDSQRRSLDSHMITAGLDWKPTDRLTLSARREQNLTDADPTYPNQTVFSGFYRLNDVSRLFFTQRLASAPITPISDMTGAGFSFSQSRRELTTGIETKLFRDTSLTGGYRLEHGENGADGFAVFGLAQKLKLSKTLALDAGFERAFHLTGNGKGYNSLTSGVTWQPSEDFIGNARYEWRDREGAGQLISAGFAGKPVDNVTALGRFQWSQGSFGNQDRRGAYGSFGVAVRPRKSDRTAAFFNYQYRNLSQDFGGSRSLETRHTLSADTFVQANRRLALFGKAAVSSQNTSRADLAPAANFTYLLQGRAEYLLTRRFDFGLESRYLAQPSTGTGRMGVASEVGYWATPDIRFGLGYNYQRAAEQPGRSVLDGSRRGFYFSITT